MSGLTFDWDDTDLENPVVVKALNYLEDEFGWGKVWVRVSSSGEGLHAWSLECRGRFISDSARAKTGFTTSRIFGVKNGQRAGPWKMWRSVK